MEIHNDISKPLRKCPFQVKVRRGAPTPALDRAAGRTGATPLGWAAPSLGACQRRQTRFRRQTVSFIHAAQNDMFCAGCTMKLVAEKRHVG